MPAMDEAFWANFDAQIVAQRPEGPGRLSAVTPPAAAPEHPIAKVASMPSRRVASDWTGVLDTLTAAKSAAQHQEARLREQAAEQDALVQELKRSQQEVRAFEVLLRECQAQAEARLKDAQTQAASQAQHLRAETAAQLQAMEARVQAAELRAETAEDWLRRIEQASRDLLPVTDRAAA
jgi:hypothetical protein